MKIQKLIFAAALVLLASTSISAQIIRRGATAVGSSSDSEKDSHSLTIEIPQVALLDIESSTSKNISLTATAPTEAGEKVIFNQTNSDLWLNYSSIIEKNASRNVTVQITDGDVPEGVDLSVIATQYEGNGEGAMGTVDKNAIELNDNKAQTIIKGIGSAYTGNGAKQGHNLTYSLTQTKDAYENLKYTENNSLTITYTLTDN
ncbi:hypothetical protein [Lutibacter citreus]|uniref:hypothetical protein n=1 Tax=Lutibacter citreus TaxID=2138210 RepID=UPI000DBE9D19|nr:hypothetical protein [Lutibacter citreus]